MLARSALLVLVLLSSCFSYPSSKQRDDFTRTTLVTSTKQREPMAYPCVWTSIRAQRKDGEDVIYSLRFRYDGDTVLGIDRILDATGAEVPFVHLDAGYRGGAWEEVAAIVPRAWLEARAATGFTMRVYGRGYLDAIFRPAQIREVLDAADREFGAPAEDLPEFAGA